MSFARKKIGKSDIGKSRDRGPKEFRSRHAAKKEEKVMLIAAREVVTTHGRNSIKNVAKLMRENDFRRIPITNAGTGRLEGLAVAIDILDFLGGGTKYNIISQDYRGNFLAAINCPIQKIGRGVEFMDKYKEVGNAIEIMLKKKTSAIPIVDNKDDKKVIGIITERDVLPRGEEFGILVEEVMQRKPIIATPGMMLSDVAKIMVRNGYRRLPTTREGQLIGIITVFDVLEFLSYGEFKGSNAEEILAERVEKIMERKITAVSPLQDLAEISKLIKETGKGGFPVVENEKLVGLITASDIIRGIYGERS